MQIQPEDWTCRLVFVEFPQLVHGAREPTGLEVDLLSNVTELLDQLQYLARRHGRL